jgi:hypothetical protein
VLGFASALAIASPSAAFAASYLDEAVQALQTGNVYVSVESQTIDAATKERLIQQTKGTNIGVVVLPEGARTEAGDIPQFVVNITGQSGKETVIVAVGKDLEAASRTMSSGSAGKLANDLERSNPSTGDALVKFVTEARSSQPASPSQQNAGPDPSGFLIPAAVVVALGGAGVAYWRRRNKTSPRSRNTTPVLQAPDTIQELLDTVSQYHVKDQAMQSNLNQSVIDTEELFKRLKKAKSGEIAQITAKYEELLTTVRNILVKYVDVQDNPRYYSAVQRQGATRAELLDYGQKAIAQYAAGVVKNINEAELGSLTDFRVNAKMLEASNLPDDPFIR